MSQKQAAKERKNQFDVLSTSDTLCPGMGLAPPADESAKDQVPDEVALRQVHETKHAGERQEELKVTSTTSIAGSTTPSRSIGASSSSTGSTPSGSSTPASPWSGSSWEPLPAAAVAATTTGSSAAPAPPPTPSVRRGSRSNKQTPIFSVSTCKSKCCTGAKACASASAGAKARASAESCPSEAVVNVPRKSAADSPRALEQGPRGVASAQNAQLAGGLVADLRSHPQPTHLNLLLIP